MSKIVPLEGFGGGSSSPLNFKIVAYATEEELAAAQPKENTIWVNTDAEITGWHFGADEPNFYTIKSDEEGYCLYAPHKLTEGEIISFIVPKTITVGFEWIRFVDGTGQDYCVRNGGGTLLEVWPAGVKISVKISNDLCTMGEYRVRTAYVYGFGNYFHEEGTVWITTGASSSVAFNALKKNGIQVYPISAKQYISGAWVDKTAKSYQGGVWVDWIVYLYNKGQENTALMGEFTSKGISNGGGGALKPTVTKGNTAITIDLDGNFTGGIAYWPNPIDLSPFKTLKFKGILQVLDNANNIDDNNQKSWSRFCVWTSIPTYYFQNAAVYAHPDESLKLYEITLDISALNGEYYIGFDLYHESYVKIEQIWLE